MATAAIAGTLTITLLITAAAAASCVPPSPPPSPISAILSFLGFRSLAASCVPQPPPPSPISAILSSLGFRSLAAAAAVAHLSSGVPTTVFAPTDSALLTCPTCSIPLLLREHSIPGLYPLHFLRTLAFGTKIESLAPNRCLTVTPSALDKKVFINGVEITKPDLFNNGLLIIHALQGFVSHSSPLSCNIETMTSLSFPLRPPSMEALFDRQFLLKEAMTRLRTTGYSIVALAMRVKFSELSDLECMTLFAVDDQSIFLVGGGGRSYLAEFRFHIVPNMLLRAANLTGLERGTALPTMKPSQKLVVTTTNSGGPLAVMRINYVKVKSFDVVHNDRIVVHGLPMPFHDVGHLVK